MQHEAAQTIAPSAYWACGDVPLLEVIGAHDPLKPRPYWHELRDQFGKRVTTVIIQEASHALFPEQPDAVAGATLSWAAHDAR
jgi:pimeloyl-ACP methyl ester carboxylesterase